jgi:hypothetical protein
METKVEYPEKLYETPDCWGDVFVVSRDIADATVASLQSLGGEWSECGIDECDTYTNEHDNIYRIDGTKEDIYFSAVYVAETKEYKLELIR